MNKTETGWMDIVLYLVVFLLIGFLAKPLVQLGYGLIAGIPLHNVFNAALMSEEQTRWIMIASMVLSSILTIVIFLWRKWSPFSRSYLQSNPWAVIVWTILLACGSILPSEWMSEELEMHFTIFSVPAYLEQMEVMLMKSPLGYLAVGIFVPIAEEMVFRGAILRCLLKFFDQRKHWWPIVISALLFALVHGNLLQGTHAFLVGLLIGWMYYRTDSIVPGIVFHWINNSVAFLMIHLMPQMNDGKLIDLFHGDSKMMWMGLGFSLCIFLPSLFQLMIRLKKSN
ncbi:MAG: CPBP family intramembrane metalloprotease [Prevotella sp.]|jgi:membrane protease YdiL (CAAX protease family)|nr:CPBP family intramembrane metalloprotease [Prevotella sp.]